MLKYAFRAKAKFIFIFLFILLSSHNVSASEDSAKNFIKSIGDEVVKIITDSKLNDKNKERSLETLFDKSFDISWTGRFVLGRYWRSASKLERKKYLQSYRKFLISSYVPRFKEYNGHEFEIKSSTQKNTKEYLVQTEIISDGVPVFVEYLVRKNQNGGYQIRDIIAEGISLINTQRSEFGSVVSRKGIDGLIDILDKKIKSTKKV